jgi:hypothetical protein
VAEPNGVDRCYAAGECVDRVPYYQMECARDDAECLARKRRLASKEVLGFVTDPTSSPVLGVFALFLLGGPLAAAARLTLAVIRKLLPPPAE